MGGFSICFSEHLTGHPIYFLNYQHFASNLQTLSNSGFNGTLMGLPNFFYHIQQYDILNYICSWICT